MVHLENLLHVNIKIIMKIQKEELIMYSLISFRQLAKKSVCVIYIIPPFKHIKSYKFV